MTIFSNWLTENVVSSCQDCEKNPWARNNPTPTQFFQPTTDRLRPVGLKHPDIQHRISYHSLMCHFNLHVIFLHLSKTLFLSKKRSLFAWSNYNALKYWRILVSRVPTWDWFFRRFSCLIAPCGTPLLYPPLFSPSRFSRKAWSTLHSLGDNNNNTFPEEWTLLTRVRQLSTLSVSLQPRISWFCGSWFTKLTLSEEMFSKIGPYIVRSGE